MRHRDERAAGSGHWEPSRAYGRQWSPKAPFGDPPLVTAALALALATRATVAQPALARPLAAAATIAHVPPTLAATALAGAALAAAALAAAALAAAALAAVLELDDAFTARLAPTGSE